VDFSPIHPRPKGRGLLGLLGKMNDHHGYQNIARAGFLIHFWERKKHQIHDDHV